MIERILSWFRKPAPPRVWSYTGHTYLGHHDGAHVYAVTTESDGESRTRRFRLHHQHSDERLAAFFTDNSGGGE